MVKRRSIKEIKRKFKVVSSEEIRLEGESLMDTKEGQELLKLVSKERDDVSKEAMEYARRQDLPIPRLGICDRVETKTENVDWWDKYGSYHNSPLTQTMRIFESYIYYEYRGIKLRGYTKFLGRTGSEVLQSHRG